MALEVSERTKLLLFFSKSLWLHCLNLLSLPFTTANHNSLFRSRDWLSANQGPVLTSITYLPSSQSSSLSIHFNENSHIIQSDPDLVTSSGERVLGTKSGWALNRGQITLIFLYREKFSLSLNRGVTKSGQYSSFSELVFAMFEKPFPLPEHPVRHIDYLSELVCKTGNPILMGDFNFQVQDTQNFYAKKLLGLLDSLGFDQRVPLQPTHVRGGTLDLLLCQKDRYSKVRSVEVFPEGTTSDHFLVLAELCIETVASEYKTREKVDTYRDFKAVDIELLRCAFRCVDWSEAMESGSAEEVCSIFFIPIHCHFDLCLLMIGASSWGTMKHSSNMSSQADQYAGEKMFQQYFFGTLSLTCALIGTTVTVLGLTSFSATHRNVGSRLMYKLILATDGTICLMMIPVCVSNYSKWAPGLYQYPFFCQSWSFMWGCMTRMSVFLIMLLNIIRTCSLIKPLRHTNTCWIICPTLIYLTFLAAQSALPLFMGVEVSYKRVFQCCAWEQEIFFSKLSDLSTCVYYTLAYVVEFVFPLFPIVASASLSIYKLKYSRDALDGTDETKKYKTQATMMILTLWPQMNRNKGCFRNRPNQEILVPYWLITSHVTSFYWLFTCFGRFLGWTRVLLYLEGHGQQYSSFSELVFAMFEKPFPPNIPVNRDPTVLLPGNEEGANSSVPSLSRFLIRHIDYLSELVCKTGNPILMGDFNFQVQDTQNFYAKKLLGLLDSLGFDQRVPLQPTHVRGGTLDLLLCQKDRYSKVRSVEVFPEGTTSDHFLVLAELCIETVASEYKTREKVDTYRDFKAVDIELLRCAFRCVDWSEAMESGSAEEGPNNYRCFDFGSIRRGENVPTIFLRYPVPNLCADRHHSHRPRTHLFLSDPPERGKQANVQTDTSHRRNDMPHDDPGMCVKLQQSWSFMWGCMTRMSVFLIMLLNIIRTCSLIKPLRHTNTCWIICPTLIYLTFLAAQSALPLFMGVEVSYKRVFQCCAWEQEIFFSKLSDLSTCVYYTLAYVVEFVFPLFPIVASASLSIYKLKYSRDALDGTDETKKYKTQATMMILTLTGVYLAFNFPYCVIITLDAVNYFTKGRFSWSRSMRPPDVTLVYNFIYIHTIALNSLVNSLIYVYKMGGVHGIKFRVRCRKTAHKTARRQSSRQKAILEWTESGNTGLLLADNQSRDEFLLVVYLFRSVPGMFYAGGGDRVVHPGWSKATGTYRFHKPRQGTSKAHPGTGPIQVVKVQLGMSYRLINSGDCKQSCPVGCPFFVGIEGIVIIKVATIWFGLVWTTHRGL
eukprot:sb/3461121/